MAIDHDDRALNVEHGGGHMTAAAFAGACCP
jgi:hypothetical protein